MYFYSHSCPLNNWWSNIIKKYNDEGIVGIKPNKRGRRTGEKRVLTATQEKEIMATIVDKNPDQLKLPGCMWTRKKYISND